MKKNKSYLDSLWVDTEVYSWLKLLSEGKHREAAEYADKLQREFEKQHGDVAAVCGKYIFWEGRKIAEKLSRELKSWDSYVNYMKTFDEKLQQAMYESDIFDSYMLQNLQ